MDVYVIGYASHPPAEKVLTKRLEEMVYDTSAPALRAAGIERSEIDHITIAACDELDGRSISNMLMVAPAGGYLKDELRVTDSAMVGLHLAAMRNEILRRRVRALQMMQAAQTSQRSA